VAPLIWAIFTYGLLFFVIPGVRFVVYRMINDNIEKRNNEKLDYAAKLANPAPSWLKSWKRQGPSG
jgi:hypothetical protein